jgi:hypothetical protein
MTTDDKPRIELNWIQALAAPLAAVTSAVLLSTFGVAGTLIGAALGSLALTVGNAVYAYSIKATRHRVATAQNVAAARIGLAQTRVDEISADIDEPGPPAGEKTAHDLAETQVDLDRARAVLEDADPDPTPGGWRGMLAALPWKRISLMSAAVFITAMLLIVAFELSTGRSLSSYTGSDDRRTSIPGWGDRDETGEAPHPPDEDAPADQAPNPGTSDEEDLLLPDEDPTAGATTPAPSTEPSPTPTEPTPAPVEPTPESVETAPAEPTPTR